MKKVKQLIDADQITLADIKWYLESETDWVMLKKEVVEKMLETLETVTKTALKQVQYNSDYSINEVLNSNKLF